MLAGPMAVASRYLVGIDLGTTHTVVAYADTKGLKEGEAPPIQPFAVEQLVAPGEVAPRDVLPSVRYHPAPSELAPADLSLFFGFLGLATLGLFGPIVGLLQLSGVEDLSILTPTIAGLLVLKEA